MANSKIIGGSRPSDKGGGGGGHPDSENRGGPVSKKCFGLSGLSFVKGEGGGSPGSATENGGRTKPIAKSYATHGHEPSGSESTVGSE